MRLVRDTWTRIVAFVIAFVAIGIGWAHVALGDRLVSTKKTSPTLAQNSQYCEVNPSLEQNKSQEKDVFYVGCAGFF